MKKIIIIAITAITCSAIIGGSFYIIQLNKQDSIERQKLWQSEQEKKEFILEKKVECEKYSENVIEEISKLNDRMFGIGASSWQSFRMIFYSPKENSCLYVKEQNPNREYFIYNYLTKSKITSFRFPEQWDDYKKFLFEYSDGEIRL